MKRSAIAIIVGISAAVGIGILFAYQNTESINGNTEEPEENPEIKEKLDQIKEDAEKYEYAPKPREWVSSGPFSIDRTEYVLGEKIFLIIEGLRNEEKGQIAFLRPLNETHNSVYITIPFDGMNKPAFNYYIEPQLSKTRGLCSADDIVGKWTVVFRGTDYPNLHFNIINHTLPGEEESYQPVC